MTLDIEWAISIYMYSYHASLCPYAQIVYIFSFYPMTADSIYRLAMLVPLFY